MRVHKDTGGDPCVTQHMDNEEVMCWRPLERPRGGSGGAQARPVPYQDGTRPAARASSGGVNEKQANSHNARKFANCNRATRLTNEFTRKPRP